MNEDLRQALVDTQLAFENGDEQEIRSAVTVLTYTADGAGHERSEELWELYRGLMDSRGAVLEIVEEMLLPLGEE